MTFGQLKSNITSETFFLKNYVQAVVEKLFLDPFLKYQNWANLWINILNFIQFAFIVCQVESCRNILKVSCRPCALFSDKAILKTKRGLGLVSLPHFLRDFKKRIFLLLYSINWPNFIARFPLRREIFDNVYIVTVC